MWLVFYLDTATPRPSALGSRFPIHQTQTQRYLKIGRAYQSFLRCLLSKRFSVMTTNYRGSVRGRLGIPWPQTVKAETFSGCFPHCTVISTKTKQNQPAASLAAQIYNVRRNIDKNGKKYFWRLAPLFFLRFCSGGYTILKLGLAYIKPKTLLTVRYGIGVCLLYPFYL